MLKTIIDRAQQNDVPAQLQLAEYYVHGNKRLKIKKDLDQAFQWFKKAADQGNNQATLEVIKRYATGIGPVQSIQFAAEYLAKLTEATPEQQREIWELAQKAHQNQAQAASLLLAILYERGWGTATDFFQAAQSVHSTADADLESYKRCFALYTQVPQDDPNYAAARYQLAKLSSKLEKPADDAVLYAQQAIDLGSRDAVYWLAIRYLGEKPSFPKMLRNPLQGINYLQRLITQNPSDTIAANAYYLLGSWQADGCSKRTTDDPQLINYYQKAAALNHAGALEKLANDYLASNPQQAVDYLEKRIQLSSPIDSLKQLAELYLFNEIVKDHQKAEKIIDNLVAIDPRNFWAKTRQGILLWEQSKEKNEQKALDLITTNLQPDDSKIIKFVYNWQIQSLTEQQHKKLYNRLSCYAFNNSSPALKLLIGFCLKQGLGTPQNLQQARSLFEAAAPEDQDAYHQLALLDPSIREIDCGILIGNQYQVFNAQSEAMHLTRLTNSKTPIEPCLESLEFFKQVLNTAEKIAATTIIASAHLGISMYHLSLQQRPNQDIDQGWKHLLKATEMRNHNAHWNAAYLYKLGLWTEKNNTEYFQHLKQASETDPEHLEIFYELGGAYERSIGTTRNVTAAASCYQKCYEKWPQGTDKQQKAGYQFAMLYYELKQHKQAFKLLKELADNGFYQAIIQYANFMKGEHGENQGNANKATKFYLESKNYYLKGLESIISKNDNQQNEYIKNKLIELEACRTYNSIKNISDNHRLKKTNNSIVNNINENLPNHLKIILNTMNECYVSRSPAVFSMTDDQKNKLKEQLNWLQASKNLLFDLKATKAKFKPMIQKIDDCLSSLHTCLETARQYAPTEPSVVASAPTDLPGLVHCLAVLDTAEPSSSLRQVIAQAELSPIQPALPREGLPKI